VSRVNPAREGRPRTRARPRAVAQAIGVLRAVLPLALAIAVLGAALPAAASAAPRLSLNAIEPDFICVVCHESLNVANSPEAAQERSVLSGLINQGDTLPQIENAMVAEYGPTVLGVPKAQGFNLMLYVLPPVLLLAGIASLAVILPRWRRRARAAAALLAPAAPPLDTADTRRLEEELASFDG